MSIMSRYTLCCYRKIHDPITEEFQARPPPPVEFPLSNFKVSGENYMVGSFK